MRVTLAMPDQDDLWTRVVAERFAAPGSTSQRTFERLGFQVLYTRAVFVRT